MNGTYGCCRDCSTQAESAELGTGPPANFEAGCQDNEPAVVRHKQTERTLHMKPTMLLLDSKSQLYALQDENGNTIGTGTRDVCEVLLYIVITGLAPPNLRTADQKSGPTANVRSAISI